MHRWTVCGGVAIALMIGCTEPVSSAADMPHPPSPEPVAQNCAVNRSVEYPAYVRTIEILQRSGEIGRASEHFKTVRGAVDRTLKVQDSSVMAEVALVLDPLFSDKEVRKRGACEFTRYSRDASTIDAWNAWVSDRTMRDIHARIVEEPSPAAAKPIRVDASRRELLRRIWVAIGHTRFAVDRRMSVGNAEVIVKTALDPTAPTYPLATIKPPATPPDEQVVIDQWLAVQLAKVSDRDLQRYLAFVESEPGNAFYRSLRATYTSAMTEWNGWLAVETRTKIAPKVAILGPEAITSHLADVRRALDAMDARNSIYSVKERLDNLALQDPKNAEVKILQGRVQLDMLATLDQHRSPYEKHQIRAPASDQESMRMWAPDRPEPFLLAAVALAPANAEAQAFLGRVRFFQRQDAEAARLFAEARRLDPDEPNVSLFEGDLAYANGEYSKAERSYRDALARPNGRIVNYFRASAQLRETLTALGRVSEYGPIMKALIQRHPEFWELRLHYVEDLMDRGGSSAEALSVLEPVPRAWLGDRGSPLRNRIQVQKVIEAVPSSRAKVVENWEIASFDTEAIGKALCQAKRLDVVDVVFKSPKRPDAGIHIARSMIGCAVLKRRPDAVAAALPYFKDINEPVNSLWQDTALCGAAALGDVKVLTLLLKAKADPQRPCTGGKTVHQRLVALAAKGDAGARAALAEFEKYSAGK